MQHQSSICQKASSLIPTDLSGSTTFVRLCVERACLRYISRCLGVPCIDSLTPSPTLSHVHWIFAPLV